MKIKYIAMLAIGIPLWPVALAEETGTRIPEIDQLNAISVLSARSMWLAEFYPNGAARLRCVVGTESDKAVAAEGSMPFEGVYNRLVPHLRQGGSHDDMWIAFGIANASIATSFRTDKEDVRALMCELRDKAIPPSKARFQELLSKWPLLPRDEPTPFVYDESLDIPDLAVDDTPVLVSVVGITPPDYLGTDGMGTSDISGNAVAERDMPMANTVTCRVFMFCCRGGRKFRRRG